jgi:hypothetical protein
MPMLLAAGLPENVPVSGVKLSHARHGRPGHAATVRRRPFAHGDALLVIT